MWLSVSVPKYGVLCIDISNPDPSVHDVEESLGQILDLDFSQYDFMLGSYRLTDSMLLADFGLTDGNGELTLMHCTSTEGEASKITQDMLQSDPIEDCSPNMSEIDPIDFTPPKYEGKTGKCKKKRKSHKRYRSTPDTCQTSERFAYPKWKSSA